MRSEGGREEVDPFMGSQRGAGREWTLLWGVRGGQRRGGPCHSPGMKGHGGGGTCPCGGKRGHGGGGPCHCGGKRGHGGRGSCRCVSKRGHGGGVPVIVEVRGGREEVEPVMGGQRGAGRSWTLSCGGQGPRIS